MINIKNSQNLAKIYNGCFLKHMEQTIHCDTVFPVVKSNYANRIAKYLSTSTDPDTQIINDITTHIMRKLSLLCTKLFPIAFSVSTLH